MAHTLTGSDWNNTASWDDADVPDAGEHVFLGPDSPALTAGPTGANQDVKLGSFITHPLYKYDVCSSGSPLICSAAKMLLQHAGNTYFQSDAGGAANKTDEIIVRSPAFNGSQVIQLGKATDAGEIDYIEVLRGNVTLVDPTGLNEVVVDHVNNPTGDALLTINSAAGTVAWVKALAGRVRCSTTVTAAHVEGVAEWEQLLNTLTNLYAGWDSKVYFDATGTVGRARVGGRALLDLTRNLNVKTFTALSVTGQARLRKFDDASVHVLPAGWDRREAA